MRRLQFFLIGILLVNSAIAQSVIEVNSVEAQSYVDNYNAKSEVIIDGRTQTMFESGHLKNAVNINAFSKEAEEELTKYLGLKRMVVYCTNRTRSELIIDKLKLLEYCGEIIFVSDGINGWKSNGFDVITGVGDENES
jgi:rhodanese-related sulfurtransferase